MAYGNERAANAARLARRDFENGKARRVDLFPNEQKAYDNAYTWLQFNRSKNSTVARLEQFGLNTDFLK
jgi:hypothetical protein